MSEIEDVPRACACAPQKIRNFGSKFGKGSEESHWIEISLNGRTIADVHPCLIDIDAPIDTNHIATGSM